MAKWTNFVRACAKEYGKNPTPANLKVIRKHIGSQVKPGCKKEALADFDALVSSAATMVSMAGSAVSFAPSTVASRAAASTVVSRAAASTVVSRAPSTVVSQAPPPKKRARSTSTVVGSTIVDIPDQTDDILDFDALPDDWEDEEEEDSEQEEKDELLDALRAGKITEEQYESEILKNQDRSRQAREKRSIYNKIIDDEEAEIVERRLNHSLDLLKSKCERFNEILDELESGATTKKRTKELEVWRDRLDREIEKLKAELAPYL